MSGFSGWRAGEVQFGKREDEVIVRLSGQLAHTNWRKFYALANNTSRLDLEVTTRTISAAHTRIVRHLKQAKRWAAKRKKPPFVGRYSANDGAETVYLNRRVSDAFGRVYDKGRESKLAMYDNCVRYEVEFKGRRAGEVAAQLYLQESESAEVCGRVARFVTDRGLLLPTDFKVGVHSGLHRSASDCDRKLAWMLMSVRPSVIALIRNNRLDEVLKALSLEEIVTPNNKLRAHQSRRPKSYVN